jgi:hypothetical protein
MITVSFVNPGISDFNLSVINGNSKSCEQISANEFLVNSDSDNSCILWAYINVRGKVQIDIEKYETDTKVYTWWTTGQFLMKTPVVELSKKSNLINIPKARNSRLIVKSVCGTAKVRLTEKSRRTMLKN